MLPTTHLMRGAGKTATGVVHVRSRHPIRSAVYQPACCNRDYAVCPMRSDGHKSSRSWLRKTAAPWLAVFQRGHARRRWWSGQPRRCARKQPATLAGGGPGRHACWLKRLKRKCVVGSAEPPACRLSDDDNKESSRERNLQSPQQQQQETRSWACCERNGSLQEATSWSCWWRSDTRPQQGKLVVVELWNFASQY